MEYVTPETRCLRETLQLFFRCGRLGFDTLLRILPASFRKSKHGFPYETQYLTLYTAPSRGAKWIARESFFTRKDWWHCAISAAKYRIRRNESYPETMPSLPFFSAFLQACDQLDDATFLRICADRLRFHYFFPADDPDAKTLFHARLSKIDDEAILSFPMPREHAYWFLVQKQHANHVPLPKEIDCELFRARLSSGTLTLKGVIRAPELSCLTKPVLSLQIDGETREIPLFDASQSYVLSYEKTANFYAFQIEIPYTKTMAMCRLRVTIDGNEIPLAYRFSPICGQKFVTISGNEISIYSEKSSENDTRIWLYSDYTTSPRDNAYFQFQHDIKIHDGVTRYYITHAKAESFPAEYQEFLVPFGSETHRALYCRAEKIFASFVDAAGSVNPYDGDDFAPLADSFHAEIIYLQHGVLHAHIPWRYSPVSDAFRVDRIVVSSPFELKNFQQTYHFSREQLLPYGMPRYDRITRNAPRESRILYAPSWRAYVEDVPHTRFFQGVQELLTCDALRNFLKQYQFELDVKLHPLFATYAQNFPSLPPQIHLIDDAEPIARYRLFLTDFSSYVFDFVYLETPILYFFPDRAEFSAGNYQYRALDLPLENGFGKICETSDEVIEALSDFAARDFQPEPLFQKRMQDFFFPLDDCREKIYRAIQ